MRTRARAGQVLAVAAGAASLAGLVIAMTPAPAAGSQQPEAVAPGTITTIAGGVGGPAPSRSVGLFPCGLTFARGALYETDGYGDPIFLGAPSLVRHISAATGQLTTLAGTGTTADAKLATIGTPTPPQPPDGTRATLTPIEDSCGIAVDHSGNVLVSDSTNYRVSSKPRVPPYGIRVIARSTGKFYGRKMTKGDEYTLIKATDPRLHQGFAPGAIAVDAAGNVLFTGADQHIYARAVRAGTFYGIKMKARGVYVVAGGGRSLASGIPARQASLAIISRRGFIGEVDAGLRLDHHGNLVFADAGDSLVRVIAGHNGRFYGTAMRAGRIYTIAGDRSRTPQKSPDGGIATNTGLRNLTGIAVDRRGNVLIDAGGLIQALAESSGKFYNRKMVRGHLYKIIGSFEGVGGNGVAARKAGEIESGSLAVDGSGNVLLPDFHGLQVVPTRAGRYYGVRMQAMHAYSISDAQAYGTRPLDSGSGLPAPQAELYLAGSAFSSEPAHNLLAEDQFGDIFVLDGLEPGATGHRRAGLEIEMVAAVTGDRFGQRVRAGHIYRIAGNGGSGPLLDTGLATSAGLGRSESVSTDGAGNLLIANGSAGRIRLVAANTGVFYGQPMTAGHIYTVAGNGQPFPNGDGGPALSAAIGGPFGVAADQAGNLLITADCELRVVAAVTGTQYGQAMTAGDIYTIAGTSSCSDSGDGGPAVSARLARVGMDTVDSNGNVLFSDKAGIRVVAATTGTFYGQDMTADDIYLVAPSAKQSFAVDRAGNIVLAQKHPDAISVLAEQTGAFYGVPMTAGSTYRVAGNGLLGHTGDGGPATEAALAQPVSVLATSDGGIVDDEYHWLREISG